MENLLLNERGVMEHVESDINKAWMCIQWNKMCAKKSAHMMRRATALVHQPHQAA